MATEHKMSQRHQDALQPVACAARRFRDALDWASKACIPNFPPTEQAQLAVAELDDGLVAMKSVLDATSDDPSWEQRAVQPAISLLRELVANKKELSCRDRAGMAGSSLRLLIAKGVNLAAVPLEKNDLRSAPMSKAELARRILDRSSARPRDVPKTTWQQMDLKQVAGRKRKFTVRKDGMDIDMRARVEAPLP